MKRNKWQRLAAIGLCSSLLVNAFSGVTAVAETVTIESSPTAESSVKEETQASSETQETMTETSREEVTQKTEKQAEVEVEKKEDTPVKAEQKEVETLPTVRLERAVGVKEAGKVSELSTWFESESNSFPTKNQSYTVPEYRFSINIASENKTSLNMADFQLTSEMGLDTWGQSTNLSNLASRGDKIIPVSNVPTTTGLDILIPSQTLNVNYFHYWGDMVVYYLKDPVLTVPKYIDTIEVANSGIYNRYWPYSIAGYPYNIKLVKTNNSYTLQQPQYQVWNKYYSASFAAELRATYESKQASLTYIAAQQDIDLTTTYKKVTENFVDATGAKITPPSGFTQGQQTSITSNDFTYTSAKALPDTYKAGGKTYKFKGWYKGKTKPATLKTTKTPSYGVTYDDNDDLNVVYEEIEAFDFPAITYQFGFVDESGKQVDASKVGLTYDNWYGEVLGTNVADWKTINLEKGQVAPTKNNLKEIVYPAQSLEIMSGRSSQYSAANLTFALPKYYEKMSVYNKSGTFDVAYPFPSVQDNNSTIPIVEGTDKSVSKWFELKKSGSQSFVFNQTTPAAPADVQVPAYLREVVYNPATVATKGTYSTLDKPVYYYLTNRKVTENFVDTTGTKITAPTGFTQGNQIPMTSDTFKYTAAKALPASYSAGGKTYTFQGWYKGKTKPNTLTTSTTPTYNTTFDGNDDMTAVYKEEVPKASVTLTRTTAETVTSGGNVTWRATITNTSQAPLTTATIKKSTAWTTGLAAPTAMIVTPVGGTAKTVPVTATTWTNGVSLGTDIPVGKSATVQFTTKATGIAGQVLRAGITTSGNYSGISASATVRVKDNDQAIVTPTTEGFISVPTFNFGQIGIAGNTQQHGLKKAADYYGNGTRNPYLRIKKTQPNWSLTAQLSQPKSATDSLPTATRLLLGAAPVSSFSNYNQPTELKNTIGTTKVINLTANNTATNIVANQQFTGSNVYQLDFVFDNIKLEVPASQGMTGQQYQAAVTWNLVTGP
ncbi:WxL domain-containing protein [Enterococcus faecalis]|uniref:WxL domain-containing protein n=1 Tax=Enterococcus faecalis TaxID=1351 RepID=UPI0024AF32E0|nr:WxL domain-containing protein [Enterococcus faecalis]MDI7021083.1 WxL domain-containing protein [Enterococcus faecalis]